MRALVLLLLALPAAAQPCERMFQTPAHYLSGRTRDLLTRDYDSDGRPDLLVAHDAHGLTLLLNRPDGFALGTAVPLPGNALRLFEDGANIIAVGTSYLATITANGTVVTPASGNTGAAAMADFDGDRRADVAVAQLRYLRVFRGQADGTFLEAVRIEVSKNLPGLAAGDVDGDGRVDLAFAGEVHAGYLPGNGDGTFGETQTLAYFMNGVATGDFDEDGRADVLFDSEIFLTSRNLASVPHGMAGPNTVADADGDGHLDVFSGSLLYRGRGDGTFLPADAAPSGSAQHHVVADFDLDGRLDVASNGDGIVVRYAGRRDGSAVAANVTARLLTGDINGDGRDDLVAVPWQGLTYAYTAGPDGTLRLAATLGSSRWGGALGDFNGDGKDDLLRFGAEPRLALGAATAPLAIEVDPGLPAIFVDRGAAVGDLNADGHLDVIVPGNGFDLLRLLGDGTGRFRIENTALSDSQSVATADFNGDGRLDIVALAISPVPQWEMHYIDGAAPERATPMASGLVPMVVAADVDGDTWPDILTFESLYTLVVYRGNGDGTFRDPQRLASMDFKASVPAVTAADFSGDGRVDLLLTQHNTERARLLVQQEDGSFAETQTLFSEGVEPSAAGDFDGDGHPDVAFLASYSGTVYAHLNRCREQIPGPVPPRVRLTALGRTLTAELPSDASGLVTFYRQGPNDFVPVVLGEVPVVHGRATIITTVPEGYYTFQASYWGEGRYTRADAPSIVHRVSDPPARRRASRH